MELGLKSSGSDFAQALGSVLLVKIEASKVSQIKVTFHANHKVVSPHIMPNDVRLSLCIHICAIILMAYNI